MYAVMYHTCTVYTNFGLELILKIYVLSARERDFIVILVVSKLNMGTCMYVCMYPYILYSFCLSCCSVLHVYVYFLFFDF